MHKVLKRYIAVVYDLLLLIAVWMFATVILLPFFPNHIIPPSTHWYQAYLIAWTLGFYGFFWTHGGQTLGLRAWGLRVEDKEGNPLTWTRASLRLLVSCLCLGLGTLTSLCHREQRGLQDILSGTRVVVA